MGKNRPDRIRCQKCNRRVRDNFQGKWSHLVDYHPDYMAQRILPLLFGHEQTKGVCALIDMVTDALAREN